MIMKFLIWDCQWIGKGDTFSAIKQACFDYFSVMVKIFMILIFGADNEKKGTDNEKKVWDVREKFI